VKKIIRFSFIAVLFVAACTRISTTEIGTGLIPAVDGVNTFDTTFQVITDNIPVDSIRTSKYQEHSLGFISNDPIFGRTQAIVNLEVKPLFYPQTFEVRHDSITLDSAVLVLRYVDVWGDTATPISFNVFEVASKIKPDSVYPNYASFAATGPQLNVPKSYDIRSFKRSDTLNRYKEPSTNQIRIPLTAAFGNKLIHTFDTTSTGPNNAYYSDSMFSERFKGFTIIPNAGANALLRIAIQDTNTKLQLYYKFTNRAGKLDTSIRYFRTGVLAGSSNNIVRTRTGFPASVTAAANSTTSDSLLYLQSGPGHRISIKIPGLQNLTNRVIHRAELYMEQVAGNSTFDNLFIAPNLFLTAYSTDSSRPFNVPNDIAYGSGGVIGNLTSFGGYITYKNDYAGNRIATYAFNISRYVQGICTRKEKAYDLNLFAPVYDYMYQVENSTFVTPIANDQLNPPGIGRVRLGGGNNKLQPMRLRIIYSKL
jgi:hypothetical protein